MFEKSRLALERALDVGKWPINDETGTLRNDAPASRAGADTALGFCVSAQAAEITYQRLLNAAE